jgi:hypothetical protein
MPACQWPYVPSGGKVSPRRDWIVPDRLFFFLKSFHSPPFYSFFIRTDYFFSISSLFTYFCLFELRHYVRSPFDISIFSLPFLTCCLGTQPSCPQGLTGVNSRKSPSTTPSSMWQRGCGLPGMLGCRTMFSPLASCRS